MMLPRRAIMHILSESNHPVVFGIHMKKAAFALLFLLASCSGIQVIRDDYRNTTIVEMPVYNTSDDRYGQRRSIKTVFKRFIDGSSKNETLSFRLQIHMDPADEKLTETIYLKIDDQLFTQSISNLSTGNETHLNSQMNRATGQQEVYAYNLQTGGGTVVLPPEIRAALARCERLQIRVYSGDRPFSFTYTGYELARLKHFLAYTVD